MKLLATITLALCSLSCAAAERGQDFPGLATYLEQATSPDPAWLAYLDRSQRAAAADKALAESERSAHPLSKEERKPAKGRSYVFDSEQPDSWYTSGEGRAVTANIISFQAPNGGWSKALGMRSGPRLPGQDFAVETRYTSTLDNEATIAPLRHLARAHRVTGDEAARQSALKGLQFLLDSQYPNGGWPQIWPLKGSYHDCVTYNDNAMANAMRLLFDISNGDPDFAWLDPERLARIQSAHDKAIECVLLSQVFANEKLTGWGQQHHPVTLAPAPARAFEMVSLSTAESAALLDRLMSIEQPDEKIIRSIEAAAEWLKSTAIEATVFVKDADGERRLIPTPGAKPIWPRFLEIGTNRALFGDRDGTVYFDVSKISPERRDGYTWYASNPDSPLKRYAKWRERHRPKN